jgi:hypothetical protein
LGWISILRRSASAEIDTVVRQNGFFLLELENDQAGPYAGVDLVVRQVGSALGLPI